MSDQTEQLAAEHRAESARAVPPPPITESDLRRVIEESHSMWQGSITVRLAAEVLELRQRIGIAQETIAGYRLLVAGGEQEIAALKPGEISYPAVLDALPDRAVVRDDTGLTFAHETGRWYVAGPIRGDHSSAEVLEIAGGSVTVLWVPTPAGEGERSSAGHRGGEAGGSDPSALIAEGRRMLATARTPLPWWVGPDGDIYGSDGHADSPLVAENPVGRDASLLAWAATNLPALLDALEAIWPEGGEQR
jgi:hypothetical protein